MSDGPEKMMENLEKLMGYLLRTVENFNQHAVSIQVLTNHLMKPILVDDRGLAKIIHDIRCKHQDLFESMEKLDIVQTLAEIKYIGKRLNEIEGILKGISDNGIRKKIDLEFFVDGYELVKKPVNYLKEEPIKEPNEALNKLLSTLTDREMLVLIHYYGLFGKKNKTLAAIGKLVGVSQEPIRQCKFKALRKLKHPSRKDLWKDVPNSKLKEDVFGENNG